MKCPGQDTKYWKPGAIFDAKCPKCEHPVEFFKDDTTRRCGNCGHRFVNPNMDFGCAAYCQFAEQCLGTMPEELLAQKEDLLKDRVAIEMKRYFKSDFKQISHATRTARYAERIGKIERANMALILAAAYLQRIGINEARRKHGRAGAQQLAQESPPIARGILEKLQAREPMIAAVCKMLAQQGYPETADTPEHNILSDAVLIADMEDRIKAGTLEEARLPQIIDEQMITDSGKAEARKVLLRQS